MQEQQRFAVALGGVGGCLVIALAIVVSGPRDVTAPPVHGVPVAFADRLPLVPMPSWSDVAISPRPTRATGSTHLARRESREVVPVARSTSADVVLASASPRIEERRPLPSSLVSRQATMPVVLGHGPVHATTAAAPPPAREHGAVTGAFFAAGTHVGGGFKTVGRTLRRVF